MALIHHPATPGVLVAAALIVASAPLVPLSVQAAEEAPVTLAPHLAVYDLALGRARDASQVASVRGRILYDFDGNACEGYTLKFRQVSELDSGEGKVSTSDLRSTTWEGGDAKRFKFTSQNFLDQNLVDTVDGNAEHGAGTTAVKLAKPEHKALDIDAAVVANPFSTSRSMTDRKPARRSTTR
jgi:hypothetical protein